MPTFEGTSHNFDFQEALNNAVENALNSEHIIDEMVRFTVSSISGVKGGIVGFKDLTVEIKTTV
jgi:hypothetical protein